MTNDQKKIESIFKELGDAVQAHPCDFLKEDDIVGFLYSRLLKIFPERVPLTAAPTLKPLDIFKKSEKMKTVRVHTQAKYREDEDGKSADIVILKGSKDQKYDLYPKSDRTVGGVTPNFLSAIEVKLARTTKFFGKNGTPADIKKLSLFSDEIKYPYAILVDFFENRSEKQIAKLQAAINLSKNVKCVYASIDSFRILKRKKP